MRIQMKHVVSMLDMLYLCCGMRNKQEVPAAVGPAQGVEAGVVIGQEALGVSKRLAGIPMGVDFILIATLKFKVWRLCCRMWASRARSITQDSG